MSEFQTRDQKLNHILSLHVFIHSYTFSHIVRSCLVSFRLLLFLCVFLLYLFYWSSSSFWIFQ